MRVSGSNPLIGTNLRASLAQLVEHSALNRIVVGSIPTRRTNLARVVELADTSDSKSDGLGREGSNPSSRTNVFKTVSRSRKIIEAESAIDLGQTFKSNYSAKYYRESSGAYKGWFQAHIHYNNYPVPCGYTGSYESRSHVVNAAKAQIERYVEEAKARINKRQFLDKMLGRLLVVVVTAWDLLNRKATLVRQL